MPIKVNNDKLFKIEFDIDPKNLENFAKDLKEFVLSTEETLKNKEDVIQAVSSLMSMPIRDEHELSQATKVLANSGDVRREANAILKERKEGDKTKVMPLLTPNPVNVDKVVPDAIIKTNDDDKVEDEESTLVRANKDKEE
jgi:hypothetical protein